MRIAVNTLSIDKTKGGIRTYGLSAIAALADCRPDWKLVLLCGPYNEELFQPLAADRSNVALRVIPMARKQTVARIFADQVGVPWFLGDCDVLFTPSNVATLFPRIPQVVVVQAPLALRVIRELPYVPAGMVSSFQRRYFDWALPRSMRVADRIVAVSDFLRERLVEQFPDAAQKISHVAEGVDLSDFSPRHQENGERYLLFVSSLFPYKNAGKLLEAFRVLKREPEFADLVLKICGKDPDGQQRGVLETMAGDLGIADSVRFLGPVPHGELGAIYSGAAAFVYPSCVETFGLPVLEAMACGTPVICSDKMSVPEVAGDAALMVDPFDIGALAAAIRTVLTDPALVSRLRERGYERVKAFSWESCGEGLARELEAALRVRGHWATSGERSTQVTREMARSEGREKQ